jgi:hypothetical protein
MARHIYTLLLMCIVLTLPRRQKPGSWEIKIQKPRSTYACNICHNKHFTLNAENSNLTKSNYDHSKLNSVNELYRLNDRRLSAKLVPNSVDRGCHMVSVTDPYGRNLYFLDWNHYYFLQLAPQLYTQGWVDPVPEPLLRKSGSAWKLNLDLWPLAHRGGEQWSLFHMIYLLHLILNTTSIMVTIT